jgi:hypothetical protein
MSMHGAEIEIERAMSEEERAKLLEQVVIRNPHMRGAQVADVLDESYNADHFLSLTEPFWESDEGQLIARSASIRLRHLVAIALLAAGWLAEDAEWALVLARKAYAS